MGLFVPSLQQHRSARTLVVKASDLAAAMAAVRHEVRTLDPVTFALVPLILLAVAALATYVPARRALRVDPLAAFKAE